MSRLRRFLHIERSRAPSSPGTPAAPASPGTAGRFSGLQQPGGRTGERPDLQQPGERTGGRQAAAPASGAEPDRFAPAPPPPGAPAGEAGLELAGTAADERPFTRCLRCGMDHHRLATRCTACGEPLDTPEQRDFNDRLWARQRGDSARDEAAAAGHREARARADAELAAQRRAMGEELAREVGEAERRRLGDDLGGERWGGGRLVLPAWLFEGGAGKVLLGVGAVLLAALGIAALLGHPGPLILAGAVVVALLLPGRRRRPWWWWW